MISKRFFEGIAIYLLYTILKHVSYDFTLVSEVLFLKKPFSNFMRMCLNLWFQLKPDIWTCNVNTFCQPKLLFYLGKSTVTRHVTRNQEADV